ncbi:hypothetical protein Gpo141_00004609 [Globisporangium polare]
MDLQAPRRSSSVTVLSRDSQKPGMSKRKRLIIIGAVVVLAVVGVVVGVVVSKSSSDSTSTSSSDNSSKPSTDSTSKSSSTTAGSSVGTVSSGGSSSNSSSSTAAKITSDPTKATYSLAAFAIGDWGSTVAKDSCCSDSSTYTEFDVIAEDVVGSLMNIQAGLSTAVKPKAIIGHGDNFYWSGINGDSDVSYRFTNTFENKYTGANLASIPWVNVLGNHDYGGSSFVCSADGQPAKCASQSDLVAAIDNKFNWQAKYVSPNGNRWVLEDHFYVYTIKDATSGISIDIFNVDTNDATTHGAQQICCQCYGYAEGDDKQCNNISPGEKYCAGGDTDMFNACNAKFTAWGEDSRTQLAAKVKASTATWKIVNSHYSPYVHFDPTGMKKWFDILKDSGVHLWINGHTHGEKHDYAESLGVHFLENGAGGGIVRESASGIPDYAKSYNIVNKWVYGGQEYGFFSLTASKEWLKVQYHTADSKWTFADTLKSATVGGVATKHCWYVPSDGTLGQDCTSS